MDINSCPKIVGKFWCEDPNQHWREGGGGAGGREGEEREKERKDILRAG